MRLARIWWWMELISVPFRLEPIQNDSHKNFKNRGKKVMKKQFAVLMAAMMAAGMMAGCSSKPQETIAAATETETTVAETTEAETEAESENAGEAKADLGEQSILVAAAASLKNAYEDKLIPMFEEQYPGVTVEGTYDSSGKLQTQIEEGLEADVFMSAAVKQMKALDEEGLIASDTMVDLLENKIVLVRSGWQRQQD